MALTPDSPAIDAGSNSITGVTIPTTDQRGAIRGPAGLNAGANVDIGAYEASSSYLVTTAADSNDLGTLRTAVGWANQSTNANPENISNPAPNTIVFDTSGAFSTPQTITLSRSLGTLDLTNTTTPEAIDGPGALVVTVSGAEQVGVFNVGGSVNAAIAGLTIADGSAFYGGGIFNDGTLQLTSAAVSNNSSPGGGSGGGGIYSQGTLTLSNSTVADNSAQYGGGIQNYSGMLTLTNSTLAGNSASYGGGLLNYYGTLTLNDSTVADNSAQDGGGGIDNSFANGTVTLGNTIIAGNSLTTSGGSGPDVHGPVNSLGYSLVGNTSGSTGLSPTTDLLNVNPLLSPLGNYGGPTQTFALLPGSPAINVGKNALIPSGTTTDQRGPGFPRIVNGTVDIGAFESSGLTVSIFSGNNQSTSIGTSFSAPLVVTVASVANDEPVAGGVITFTLPGSGPSATLPGATQFATASIDGSGHASSGALTANLIVGSYAALASANGVKSGASFSLTNLAGPAAQLVIHNQPSGTATAGSPFSTQPVVYVADRYGNLVTDDDTTQVTASLRVGAGPLLGSTTATASGGIASFTNLQDNKAETIILLFTAPALFKTQSSPTTINPAGASSLFITAPASATAGRAFTITVTAFDPYNNVATSYRGTIRVTSSDARAALPNIYTFTSGDDGAHTFGNVTLRTSGMQRITAYDFSHPSIIGSACVDVGSAGESAGGQAHPDIEALVRLSTPRAAVRTRSRPDAPGLSPRHTRREIACSPKLNTPTFLLGANTDHG
jgi:predicted outer membrane repeat protein